MKKNESFLRKDGQSLILPFILVTVCFALWGFANDITNPLVEAFSKIFRMNVTQGALVQTAFYGGYFVMAFPAALFIRRYSYRAGVLLGLFLYALGALLFFPAKMAGTFPVFLLAYFVLTCGLSFLETSCNPYILSMGAPATATRRLNLAQCFNPIGSLSGMAVAMVFIQAQINPAGMAERELWDEATFREVMNSDLTVLIRPYLWVVAVIAVLFVLLCFVRVPSVSGREEKKISNREALRRLWTLPRYREGVVAQFFYVGAQIMCWTFVIQYGKYLLMHDASVMDSGLMQAAMSVLSVLDADTYAAIQSSPVITEAHAAILSQMVNIMAMAGFCVSRFVCTFLLRYIPAGLLLGCFALMACGFTLCVIFSQGIAGLCALIGISVCMSLMFPTIYGIALEGMGEEAKFGAAGLIMSILGGSVLPPLQGAIIDAGDARGMLGALPSVNLSFVLPLISFVVIGIYGYRVYSRRLA
ncbi:MAG: L-fucose:H+ symporter permease [Clostridium sp.]|nr:L-fucose:H+ symporter permease [Clostridium sp.]